VIIKGSHCDFIEANDQRHSWCWLQRYPATSGIPNAPLACHPLHFHLDNPWQRHIRRSDAWRAHPEQVQQLQDSLRSLQAVKGSGEGLLQQFRSLKAAKLQIGDIMNAGSFRPQDRQTVLDDLNNLGPKGGGSALGRNGL
jgi:hypothetical protein